MGSRANNAFIAGAFNLLVLAGCCTLTPWPQDWVGALLAAASFMVLERFALPLEGDNQFSPAEPAYLGAALFPSVGVAWVSLFVLVESVVRRGRNFPQALGTRTPLVLALLGIALVRTGYSQEPYFGFLIGPPILAGGILYQVSRVGQSLKGADRVQWLNVRLRLRPLQVCLAAASLVVVAAMQQSPWFLLALVPILAATRLSAESLVLRAKDVSTVAVLSALKEARGEERKTQVRLRHAQAEKQLMEGFVAHLAREPGLRDACESLLVTVQKLFEVQDVAIFLTPAPGTEAAVEPFLYVTQPDHQGRLQGAALTNTQEPVVDTCWRSGKPQQQSPSDDDRLFVNNQAGVAVPLGEFGVLYLGRETEMFSAAEKKRLQWLSSKARLAFDVAFRAHTNQQNLAQNQLRVRTLEHRLESSARMLSVAEAAASSLKLDLLISRTLEVLMQSFSSQRGLVHCRWDQEPERQCQSGFPDRATHPLVERVYATGLPLHVPDFQTEKSLAPPAPDTKCAVCVPIKTQEQTNGVIMLCSTSPNAYDREQLEQLRVMAYQLSMAISNARLFEQVVKAHKQLEDSQRTLIQESKLSAIGKLAAGVAHELNTPLGVIRLSLDEISENLDESPEFSRKMLQRAVKAVDRSRSITDHMLAYSRKPSEEEVLFRLDQAIEETLSFIGYELKKHRVSVSKNLLPLNLMGRPQEMHQVLVNLVMNSIHAMETKPENERTLSFQMSQEVGRTLLDVVDSGEGISQDKVDRIFEPFFTTKDVGRGTGLGLWVCHQFVEHLDGTIEVFQSSPDGTTIRVTFPRGAD